MPASLFLIAAALTLCAGPLCLQLDPQDVAAAPQGDPAL